ncbi:type VI secretion system-associated protein TagO [Brucella gallinifaecis]|uniref:type VI secretion system-associated protein TagO n=1 Tax=Brucella gallinifaecis TaxID=215590 RepID=UPI00363AD8D6
MIVVVPVQAEDSGNSCAKENDAAKRLLCYDGIFRNEIKTDPITEGTGKWRSQTDVSKIADTADHYAALQSEDKLSKRFGGTGYAQIHMRCKENKTSAYFTFADQFLSDIQNYGKITYRLDTDKAVTKGFNVSTDNTGLGLWSGGSAIPFLKSLEGHKQLVVRVTPFNQSAITVTFDIRGFDEAVKPIRSACKW